MTGHDYSRGSHTSFNRVGCWESVAFVWPLLGWKKRHECNTLQDDSIEFFPSLHLDFGWVADEWRISLGRWT